MNRYTLKLRDAGAALALTLALGCQGSGSFGQINEHLSQISAKQEELNQKMDALSKKLDNLPSGGAKKPGGGRPDPKATYKVEVGDAHVKGPDDAKITIVEWSDFQCPFCKRVNPTLKQVEQQYGNDIRIAFKHNPLPMHNRATAAALAAEAAGKQGKFWEMHDILFENGRQLTDENFEKWAADLGLDVQKFKADMNSPALKKKVNDQKNQGMSLGARGTPAFFINGRFLSGAQPITAFKALIDEEMKQANALLAKGTPKSKLYETIIAKGKTKP